MINYCEQVNISGISKENSCVVQKEISQIRNAGSSNGPSIMQYEGIKIVSKSCVKSRKAAGYRIRDKDNKTCGGFDSFEGKYSFKVVKQEMPISVAFSLLAYTYEIPTLLEKGLDFLL